MVGASECQSMKDPDTLPRVVLFPQKANYAFFSLQRFNQTPGVFGQVGRVAGHKMDLQIDKPLKSIGQTCTLPQNNSKAHVEESRAAKRGGDKWSILGHTVYVKLILGNWTCSCHLKNVSPLIQEGSSVQLKSLLDERWNDFKMIRTSPVALTLTYKNIMYYIASGLSLTFM